MKKLTRISRRLTEKMRNRFLNFELQIYQLIFRVIDSSPTDDDDERRHRRDIAYRTR